MERSLIQIDVEVSNKEDAVRYAGDILFKNGYVTKDYVDAMIKVLYEFGPYIVITKGVAMPHARPEEGAIKSGFCFIRLKEPIIFGNEENDPVDLIIGLSAKDNDQHLKIIQSIIGILDSTNNLYILKNGDVDDIYKLIRKEVEANDNSSCGV